MTGERDRPDDLVTEFTQNGWTILEPALAVARVGFMPDHLLRKGNDYLVLQIEEPGRKAERPIAEMRRTVEVHPNWHFAVKLRPSNPDTSVREVENAEDRLSVVRKLLDAGHRPEAILIAWVAIEASLRRLAPESSTKPSDLTLPTLLRRAYEADSISDTELKQIDRAKGLRNQIVHGFKVSMIPDEAERIFSLARTLAERAGNAGPVAAAATH